jgi:hypothetical protein
LNNKCVYIHRRSTDNSVFYVGSGAYPSRAYEKNSRSEEWKDIVEKCGLTVEIVYNGLSASQAFDQERQLFNKYKDLLINSISPGKVKFISKAEFSEYLEYDESSCTKLRWIKKYSSKTEIGQVAGNNLKSPVSYPKVSFKNSSYLIHRIVYTLCFGEIPEGMVVDHIDGNKKNNSKSNLRLTTPSQNCLNREQAHDVAHKGLPQGVATRVVPAGKVYEAYFHLNGKQYRKSFSVKKYGEELAIQNAIAWRSQKIREFDIKVSDRHFKLSNNVVVTLPTNMYGEPMITRAKARSNGKSDSIVFVIRKPKTFTRAFSIDKYGYEQALLLAIQARDNYLAENNIKLETVLNKGNK